MKQYTPPTLETLGSFETLTQLKAGSVADVGWSADGKNPADYVSPYATVTRER